MNQENKEVRLLDIQIITTVIYIGSLVLSIALTYNDKHNIIKDKRVFTNKHAANLSIFNRVLVVVLTFTYLYISYNNREIAKTKNQKIWPFDLQMYASEISTLATLLVLYVVIETAGEQYSIISGIENPSL